MLEILQHTPSWVFILFFALLILGVWQSRDRVVSRSRLFLLPLVMTLFSVHSLQNAFGTVWSNIAVWIAGIAVSFLLGMFLGTPKKVSYSAETNAFFVPGSWIPLILILGIFIIKYAVGIILGMNMPIGNAPVFINAVCLLFGVFSGAFLSRAISISKAASC